MELTPGVIGIFLSLLVLIWMAWRDHSVLLLAPVCALLAVAIDGQLPLMAALTHVFMPAVGQFITDYFPLFVLGAVFGRLMEDSGAAACIATTLSRVLGPRHTILAVVLSCMILTYGGVSLFVVVFTVFPLARSLFETGNLPRRLIPGTIALGSFTLTMTALPGTIQIQNQIPMQYFGTTAFAAPGLGCIGGLVMFVVGMLWLHWRALRARQNGEGFELSNAEEPGIAPAPDMKTPTVALSTGSGLPDSSALWKSLAPLMIAVVANFELSQRWIPKWNTDYAGKPPFEKLEAAKVVGSWSTILSLCLASGVLIVLHRRELKSVRKSLSAGAQAALMPLFNTASEVGYGGTIRVLAGFAMVQKMVTGVASSNPLVSEAIAVNTLAAVTGSASGGLSIAMKTLGEDYYQQALTSGLNPELLHRVASMSCGGLDSLPHNGAVITLLLICGSTHRKSYADIGMVTAVGPLLGTITVIALGSVFGCF
ncbi:MAG: GntP family permease [Planctomycetaceae bacterium]